MYTSIRNEVLVVRVFVSLMFDNDLHSTVPHIQDCGECDWKAKTSGKWHFVLQGSIP